MDAGIEKYIQATYVGQGLGDEGMDDSLEASYIHVYATICVS